MYLIDEQNMVGNAYVYRILWIALNFCPILSSSCIESICCTSII